MNDQDLIRWAAGFIEPIEPPMREPTGAEYDNYLRLSGLATRFYAARVWLRPVRLRLEQMILRTLRNGDWGEEVVLHQVAHENLFGETSKQGIALRYPLISCTPTPLCSLGCYAHDGHDVLPGPIIRGVRNYFLGEKWKEGGMYERFKAPIKEALKPTVVSAIQSALKDAAKAKAWGFKRPARIRFGSVGDVATHPSFANMLAGMVKELSFGEVRCVIYTRHPRASDLDPRLWKINFSVDGSTPSNLKPGRKGFPSSARAMWTCFEGSTHSRARVNFAVHHGEKRLAVTGKGFVCPSTRIGYPHGCDRNKCAVCF